MRRSRLDTFSGVSKSGSPISKWTIPRPLASRAGPVPNFKSSLGTEPLHAVSEAAGENGKRLCWCEDRESWLSWCAHPVRSRAGRRPPRKRFRAGCPGQDYRNCIEPAYWATNSLDVPGVTPSAEYSPSRAEHSRLHMHAPVGQLIVRARPETKTMCSMPAACQVTGIPEVSRRNFRITDHTPESPCSAHGCVC